MPLSGGSRLHHWLPKPFWVPKTSVGPGSEPLPCARYIFAPMQPQRGARGITQLQYLLQLSLANFRELRKDEVGSVGVLSLVATGTSETSSF
jgi:hypothetical protein